jgi:hypothetical protein
MIRVRGNQTREDQTRKDQTRKVPKRPILGSKRQMANIL